MSKPTKEIIELSRELKGLGYRQEIEMGDWYLYTTKEPFSDGIDECVYLSTYKGILDEEDNENAVFETETIPIPSLDQGMEWLSSEFDDTELWQNKRNGYWYFRWDRGNTHNKRFTKAKTRHEAVLQAITKVLEAK